jgi:sialate O-acetylesterase
MSSVNVLDTWANGGMYEPGVTRALVFADGSRVPLDAKWLYRPVLSTTERPPRSPWDAISGIGTLYNGMIAPLGAYGIKGVAWYQGESNTTDGIAGYEAKLRALIADYRRWQAAPIPVAIIQLPNFGKVVDGVQESGWADVREAQRRAVQGDPNSALIVAIDLGDPAELHPKNKRPVGMRTAWAFERLAYRSARKATGPQPLAATPQGDRVTVAFARGDGPIRSSGAPGPFLLCGSAAGSCHAVPATLSGARVTLAGATPADTRVRYCWADSPTCSLRDDALPASPFELAVQ